MKECITLLPSVKMRWLKSRLSRILICFEFMSGLKINFQKSAVAGVGIDEGQIKSFAEVQSCKSQRFATST